jgi:hypothetical protein
MGPLDARDVLVALAEDSQAIPNGRQRARRAANVALGVPQLRLGQLEILLGHGLRLVQLLLAGRDPRRQIELVPRLDERRVGGDEVGFDLDEVGCVDLDEQGPALNLVAGLGQQPDEPPGEGREHGGGRVLVERDAPGRGLRHPERAGLDRLELHRPELRLLDHDRVRVGARRRDRRGRRSAGLSGRRIRRGLVLVGPIAGQGHEPEQHQGEASGGRTTTRHLPQAFLPAGSRRVNGARCGNLCRVRGAGTEQAWPAGSALAWSGNQEELARRQEERGSLAVRIRGTAVLPAEGPERLG